ncbi:MAG: LLM class F420-dependent oxidoreductase [Porticoccaceae bacterium]|nr:MAG: LLM class F420-dependent oxidoreductase [Porticoccaceae bacterium]
MATPTLGPVGLWSFELRFGEDAAIRRAAAEIEALGYGALWIPGGVDGGVLADVERLLAATRRVAVATGILNIWKHRPEEVADWFHGLPEAHRSRVLLGLGVSHGPLIGDVWQRPLAAMERFLDGLEGAGVPRDQLCLAALGPRMLELAARRTAGAHPYLVPPEHSRRAREILGPGALLAPEQGVILETDPERARAVAREGIALYARLPNYRRSWRRLGFAEAEFDPPSDRLLEALFAWGEPAAIAARVAEHRAAGADHVCVQVVRGARGGDLDGLVAACRSLAPVLLG